MTWYEMLVAWYICFFVGVLVGTWLRGGERLCTYEGHIITVGTDNKVVHARYCPCFREDDF